MSRNKLIAILTGLCLFVLYSYSAIASDGVQQETSRFMANPVASSLSPQGPVTVANSVYSSVYPKVNEFKDVGERYNWAKEAIQYFTSMGILEGDGQGNFSPEANITREQYAKLLSMLFRMPDYTGTIQTFSDVDASRWSYKYIEASKQYLTGYYPYGLKPFYNPEGITTREDIAVSLVKVLGMGPQHLTNPDILKQRFSDAEYVSPELKSYVSVAVEKGLIVGSEGKIRATEPITRAETVVLLMRAIKAPAVRQDVPAPQVTPSVAPIPTPKPTTPPSESKSHTIISNKPIYLKDPTVSDNNTSPSSMKCMIQWRENSTNATFMAEVIMPNGAKYTNYVFELVSATKCDNDSIEGLFSVKRDGVTVSKMKGKLYGLNQKVDSYFKFYSEDMQWHMSGYITSRVDQ